MPRASQKDIEAARSLVRIRDGHYCQMCGRLTIHGWVLLDDEGGRTSVPSPLEVPS